VSRPLNLALALVLAGSLVAPSAHAQSDEQELAQIERDYAQVQISRDPKAIDAIAARMADDFYFYDPISGVRATKLALIQSIRTGDYSVASMSFPPFVVRVFGSTAVVQGTNDGTQTVGGKDDSGAWAWLDVFEKRDGKWTWIFSESGKAGQALSAEVHCDKAICSRTQPGFSVKR
jgi:hypothetical protein